MEPSARECALSNLHQRMRRTTLAVSDSIAKIDKILALPITGVTRLQEIKNKENHKRAEEYVRWRFPRPILRCVVFARRSLQNPAAFLAEPRQLAEQNLTAFFCKQNG